MTPADDILVKALERVKAVLAKVSYQPGADRYPVQEHDGLTMGDLRSLVALASRQQAGTAPAVQGDGWRLVPVEPTREMIEAGFKRWREGPDYTVRDACASLYRAMIAAAPPAEGGSGE